MTSTAAGSAVTSYRNRPYCIRFCALTTVIPLIFIVDPTVLILLIAKVSAPWYAIPAAELAILGIFVLRSGRAGITATGREVTLRSPLGRPRRVPWSHVAAFEVVHRPGEYLPAVRCDDGHILHTVGCAFKSRQQAAEVVEHLEAARPASGGPADAYAPWPDQKKISRADFISHEIKVFGPLAGLVAGGLALIVVGLIGSVYYAGNLGHAVRAEDGLGSTGTFVAKTETCDKGCWWSGNFTPPGGPTKHGVSLAEPDSALSAGQAVPALDEGTAGEVYLPKDSWPVTNDVLAMIMCPASVLGGAALIAVAWRRERRRRRHAAALAAGRA
jgi:hypothetical protein